jgi:1,4-dihydroxy-2-naphthoate polyprenyltransferase
LVNFAMWLRALQIIPRLEREEWDELDLVSKWLIATRAAVLPMTGIAAGIAGLLAYRDGGFDWLLFGLCALGLIMAHATNNLLNDLTDHIKGVDRDNYFRSQYGPQPLEHGLLSLPQMLRYIAATGAVALAAGAYLVYLRGGIALGLMGAGVFFVVCYTWPLKYIGLGEPAVLAVWGPLMVGGAYFITTGTWSWDAALASLPYALGATAVIFGKHIDKLQADAEKGIRTLPVLLGEERSRYAVVAMIFAQYAMVVYLISKGYFGWPMLAVFAAAPTLKQVLQVYRAPKPREMPAEYRADVWPLWYVALAFLHTRRFGLFFLLGLIGEVLFRGSSGMA